MGQPSMFSPPGEENACSERADFFDGAKNVWNSGIAKATQLFEKWQLGQKQAQEKVWKKALTWEVYEGVELFMSHSSNPPEYSKLPRNIMLSRNEKHTCLEDRVEIEVAWPIHLSIVLVYPSPGEYRQACSCGRQGHFPLKNIEASARLMVHRIASHALIGGYTHVKTGYSNSISYPYTDCHWYLGEKFQVSVFVGALQDIEDYHERFSRRYPQDSHFEPIQIRIED